ncbi:MAG: hypothetical protein HY290_01870 [Planctomycetia bacterium]|nr:hypothetical protein [Planctomycetia bacterium]
MNRSLDTPEPVEEKILDLLVDGELDPARQRELFRQLDTVPGGWRQCALAFLEARAWKHDLRSAALGDAVLTSQAGGVIPQRLSRLGRLRNGSLVALSVACAFFAGWLIRPEPAGRPVNALQSPRTHATDPDPVVAGHTDEPVLPEKSTDADEPAALRVAGILTLKFDDRGHERELQLPVIDGARLDLRQWLDQPPAVRASIVQALERRGHKVDAHRELLTVNLKDGRRFLLPVDQVDVKFAHRVYQ